MRLKALVYITAIVVLAASPACAVLLTFDDVPSTFNDLPPEYILGAYYSSLYGIGFDGGFYAADAPTWGPPHSGTKVLAWSYPGYGSNWRGMMLKGHQGEPLYAYSIAGYFSTEADVRLQMIGYHDTLDNPVASVFIGALGQSWENVRVQIGFAGGINMVEFRPITTDALSHFCADDMNVNLIPEPASLLALCVGLVPLVVRRRRG